MRLRTFIPVLIIVLLCCSLSIAFAFSTDFEGFSPGDPANALTIPGMSFSTTMTTFPWQILTSYALPPYAVSNVLSTTGGDTLTIALSAPQGAITFGYGAVNSETVKVYLKGTLIATRTLPVTGLLKATFVTLNFDGGFDTLVFSATADVVIDNITTSDAQSFFTTCSTDKRLNNSDCAAPVVVYCTADNGVDLYAVNAETSEGTLVIHMSKAQMDQVGIPVSHNVTLASQGTILLSRLTTGEFQVNAIYPRDGKPYVFVWDACPPGKSYALEH